MPMPITDMGMAIITGIMDTIMSTTLITDLTGVIDIIDTIDEVGNIIAASRKGRLLIFLIFFQIFSLKIPKSFHAG